MKSYRMHPFLIELLIPDTVEKLGYPISKKEVINKKSGLILLTNPAYILSKALLFLILRSHWIPQSPKI